MSCTAAELKASLKAILDNDYRIGEGQDYFSLTKEMIGHIGSPDPELRDDLIYDIMAHWTEADLLDAGQLRQLLHECLDSSHLFYRIGERETDSVFTRSFSSLAIALIVNAHHRHPFLSAGEVRHVTGLVEDYLHREKDVRGYVEGKGWAHAAAHAADVLDELAQCPELSDPADMQGILDTVKVAVENDYYAFIHEEDERLVKAVTSVIGRKILDDHDIVQWLDSFPARKRAVRYPEDLYLRANVKAFFRSLYLRLAKAGNSSPMLDSLPDMMARHSRF